MVEVVALNALVHLDGTFLDVAQHDEFLVLVEEHPPDDFGQDELGRAGDARVVEQVALVIVGLCVDVGRQPAYHGLLQKSGLRLQQLHSAADASKLVLPTAAGGEQLFENECAQADFVLVPCQ